MKLKFVVIIFFISVLSAAAQLQKDSTSWMNIEINDIEGFSELESYDKSSFSWHPNLRSQYLTRLINKSKYLEIDSLIFIYSEKLGVHYRELDSFALAIEYFDLAKEYSHTDQSDRILLNSTGSLYLKYNDYELALDYYFKALDKARKLNDGSEAYPLGNISKIYGILDDYENAIKYIKASIDLSYRLESPEKEYSRVYDYSYIATYFEKQEQPDSTDKYLNLLRDNITFLDIHSDQKYKDAQFIGYFTLAEINLDRGHSEISETYIDQTASKAQSFYISSVHILRARLEMLNGKFKKALDILDGDKMKEEYSGYGEILALKIECYNTMSDYKRSNKLNSKLIEYQKEKFSRSQAESMTFANAKYETFKKNEEIAYLQLQQKIKNLTIKNQGYAMLLFVGLSIFLIGVSFLLWKLFHERKKINEKLQSLVDKRTVDLKRANEELKVFNYAASHDLKEPLRTISMYSKLLRTELNKTDKTNQTKYLDFIESSVQHSNDLVENIAKFADSYELNVENFSEVNLQLVAQNTIKSLDALIKEKKGKVIILQDLPTIQSNQSLIYSVLKNLIENGIRFNKSIEPKVEINYETNQGQHIIYVKDNGIGIKQEYQKLIFESFKRLHPKSNYRGSGLGLSISKILVEKLGGQLTVESTHKNGSTFNIKLPYNT